MTPERVRVVSAAAVGDLGRLEPLARRVFGAGDRAPGWFARKLHRECVDPELSQLLLGADDPTDPQGWLGYALVGTPPSVAPDVRTSGVGVVPAARGRGAGRRLLDAVATAAAARGHAGVLTPAAEDQVEFYLRVGYRHVRGLCTLQHRARGPGDARLPGPLPFAVADHTLVVGWLVEAWERTPASQRHTLILERDGRRLVGHVSREGSAWLIQALAVGSTSGDAEARPVDLDAMLDRLPAGVVLLTALDPTRALSRALVAAGWSEAQRGQLLRRPLDGVQVPVPTAAR